MLYRLSGEILERLILPLGEFQKEDVREIARDIGLDCADAPDSMEICFIPDGDYAAFIQTRGMQPLAGRFIGPDGEDLGPHLGVDHYTVGQRKGLGLALGRPVFVKTILKNGDIQLAESGGEFNTAVQVEDVVTPDGNPLPDGDYLAKIRSNRLPRCLPCAHGGRRADRAVCKAGAGGRAGTERRVLPGRLCDRRRHHHRCGITLSHIRKTGRSGRLSPRAGRFCVVRTGLFLLQRQALFRAGGGADSAAPRTLRHPASSSLPHGPP